MAEVVVRPVINKLADLLYGEAVLFRGVRKKVESLKDELESINSFLKDAESRSEKEASNEGVKTWVKQVRDEANRIEDVIDEYIRHVSPRSYDRGFVGFLRKVGHSIKKLKERHKIASEVKNIQASLREIKERSDRYRFQSSAAEVSGVSPVEPYDPRFDAVFIEEDEAVGISSSREEIKSMLVGGKASRGVISLVGTGGVGKTTLANQVYENEAVKKHFSCRAWITVSQSYDMKKLLKNMVRQITIGSESSMAEADDVKGLIKSLKDYLKTQRYLVVFDDVWDENFWEIFKNAFPKNNKASRVMLTTRNQNIAIGACQEASDDTVHRIEPMLEDMALKLFCNKAFHSKSSEQNCPEELEELSREIVRKCQGLPLLINAISSLMATKEKSISEWRRALYNMSSEFESNNKLSSALKVLLLSYNDLPHHLKPCFLYFGIFPEDFSISEQRLYRLWIAEGFVEPRRDKTLEDVAEEYLDELIHRNLVEVSRLECSPISKMCKVHDMMRDLILLTGNDIGFCQILDKSNKIFKRKYRRLSINGGEENAQGIVEDSTVRSVFVFNVDKLTKPFMESLIKKFKLLRVLEFGDSPLDLLPEKVGNLFHLKYLGIANTKVNMLPKSVGKLQNLETLDLYRTLIKELPFEIDNLQHIRHFYHCYVDASTIGPNRFGGIKMPWRIGSLENLQSLYLVEANNIGFVNELENLRQLRSLGISKLTTELGRVLCTSISMMNCLQTLSLSSINMDEILDFESISFPPSTLMILNLSGPLLKLPHWISVLHNLFDLRLFCSNLHDDQLKLIHGLPNLQRLVLSQAYNGERLDFQEGGFLKLKILSLDLLAGLEVVEIDIGSLPRLETLEIGKCPLRNVPAGIEHLANLKTLRLIDMSEEFISTIRPEEGKDYGKVMHVSSITLGSITNGRRTINRLRDSDFINVCCAGHYPNV